MAESSEWTGRLVQTIPRELWEVHYIPSASPFGWKQSLNPSLTATQVGFIHVLGGGSGIGECLLSPMGQQGSPWPGSEWPGAAHELTQGITAVQAPADEPLPVSCITQRQSGSSLEGDRGRGSPQKD